MGLKFRALYNETEVAPAVGCGVLPVDPGMKSEGKQPFSEFQTLTRSSQEAYRTVWV